MLVLCQASAEQRNKKAIAWEAGTAFCTWDKQQGAEMDASY